MAANDQFIDFQAYDCVLQSGQEGGVVGETQVGDGSPGEYLTGDYAKDVLVVARV